jgi:hypothetical protein
MATPLPRLAFIERIPAIAVHATAFVMAAIRPPATSPSGGRSLGFLSGLAEVAQLVEHTTENRGVAGSIPALGTNKRNG